MDDGIDHAAEDRRIMSSLTAATQNKLVDRIATLESQLAEAERTIAELRTDLRHMTQNARHYQAERDEARRVAVWASKFVHSHHVTGFEYWDANNSRVAIMSYGDGTDSGIYAALRRAMGEG